MNRASKFSLSVMCAVVFAVPLVAGIRVDVKSDKTFNFAGLRTYVWRLEGANPVKMLQNTADDPEQIRKNLEPPILAAVDRMLSKKGFSRVSSGLPDLYLDYYVLIGPGVSSQYQGQFVGAVPAWGLPDFVMSTTSLTIYEQGSLIVDVVSVKEEKVVWRGAADAKVDRSRTAAERESLVNDAVGRMLEKFPPKFKK